MPAPRPARGPRRWAATLVIAGFAGLALAAYRGLYPPDEVRVDVRHLPADADFACLVADTPDGSAVMTWAIHKVLPSSIHPGRAIQSDPTGSDGEFRRAVRWEEGRRVGVVTHAGPGWRVAWFGPPKSDRTGRVPLLAGGEWKADYRAADAVEPFPDDEVRRLGLDAYPLPDKPRPGP